MDFKDTPERELALKAIYETKDKTEIENLIKLYYPGWLISSASCYSSDYKFLQTNWEHVCSLTNRSPQKIVFVKDFFFKNSSYSVLNELCDFLTKSGYCLRRYTEFVLCYLCSRAIPCKELWELIKNKDGVPSTWSAHCMDCSDCS